VFVYVEDALAESEGWGGGAINEETNKFEENNDKRARSTCVCFHSFIINKVCVVLLGVYSEDRDPCGLDL